jgi:hypothetical protein
MFSRAAVKLDTRSQGAHIVGAGMSDWWAARVHRPRARSREGCGASRSPSRFRNLGLSHCRLARQESSGITLKGESGTLRRPPRGPQVSVRVCVLLGEGDAMLHW